MSLYLAPAPAIQLLPRDLTHALLARLSDWREARRAEKVRRQAAVNLSCLDPAALADLGFDAQSIAPVRKSLWSFHPAIVAVSGIAPGNGRKAGQ